MTPAPGKSEVAIIGLGAMGALSAWRLAERGASVIGFEQFQPGHAWGSSHGDTRGYRKATVGPDHYLPWVDESIGIWEHLQQKSGIDLITQTGALLIGRPDGILANSTLAKLRQHGHRHEVLDHASMRRRYPQHQLDTGEVAILEEVAGFLRPETAVKTAVSVSEGQGALIMVDTQVTGIEQAAGDVRITTSRGVFMAERAIVTAGPWTLKLLPQLGLRLTVERQVLAWLRVAEPEPFAPREFPLFLHELPGPRLVYGFPSTDQRTIKLAVHHGGDESDIETLDRDVHPSDLEPITTYARTHLRGAAGVARTTVCMYTNSPGRAFFATSPPGLPNVTVINACNGDGFKFAAIIGELVARHLVEGTPLPRLLETTPPPREADSTQVSA